MSVVISILFCEHIAVGELCLTITEKPKYKGYANFTKFGYASSFDVKVSSHVPPYKAPSMSGYGSTGWEGPY